MLDTPNRSQINKNVMWRPDWNDGPLFIKIIEMSAFWNGAKVDSELDRDRSNISIHFQSF